MRRALPVLLLALLAVAEGSDPVGDGKTFELPLPDGVDWDVATPDRDAKVLLTTEFAGSDPKATGRVRVMVYPLSDALRKKGLDEIAKDWAATIEDVEPFKTGSKIEEGKARLGGEEAWFRDVRADWARLTWHVARKNGFLYVFHVLRTNVAMDDADLEAQIGGMRASFRFLGAEKAADDADKGRPPEPPPIDPERLKRAKKTLAHWRLELVKPEGLLEVPPEEFAKAETDNDMVAKFERRGDQTVIMVRIYARTAATRKLTLEQLAQQKVKRFEAAYPDEKRRGPVERDDLWKPPLTDRAIRLVLTGLGGTVQTTRWFLAECRNDRQYQVEVYVSGGEKDRWAKEIQELLEGFRPLRGE